MDFTRYSLKNENGPVDIDTLKRWSETEPLYKCIYPINSAHKSPYQYNPKLNNRIILWQGDITNIKADAIVHASNRTLSDKSHITRKLYEKAGVELWQEIQRIKSCPTGEVRVTRGYNLPVRYIIHTASPYYNVKYSTAAETSLISCYRNVLYKAYELGVRTLAFSVINQVRYNYPPDEGAHAALRTIRKFLEVQESLCHIVIHTIILVVESCDASIYEVLLPLYLPRSSQEQRAAILHLPIETECVHNDRRIRIIDNPQHYMYRNNDTVLDMSDYSFTHMQGDLDRQRLLGDRKPFPSEADQIIAKEVHDKERYDRLLRRAKTEDLSEISGIGCLYQSGYDRYGRPVIVFVGKWFRFKDMNLDKALLYLIYLLDPLVKGDYVVMYFHTMTSSQNYPSFSWLREVYNILPYKYKKNLKSFYIVHPTFWTRMMVWWFTTFMAPAIKQKVTSISGVEYLYSIISPKELEIPAFITEYDMTINGIRYFQPSVSSASSTCT